MLKRAAALAAHANRAKLTTSDLLERTEESRDRFSRREFLKASTAAAVAFGAGSALIPNRHAFGAAFKKNAPKIVIVGAGMAGLNAAYHLRRAGYRADIYEGNSRIGGRMFSAQNILAQGLTTELGGEFIDSGHKDMLHLARHFNLPLINRLSRAESTVPEHTFFFNQQRYSEQEVVEAFRPIASQMDADLATLDDVVDFEHEGNGSTLDNMSISQYLDKVQASGFIRALLEDAYCTEYGLDVDQQSSLNLLYLIGTDTRRGRFNIFGISDEKFKVSGGNQRIIESLVARLPGQITTGHRLEAIAAQGDGYKLTFQNNGAVDVNADILILAIPFTLLRQVDIQVSLPAFKTKAIQELGYGTNAKLLAGFNQRTWRDQSSSGYTFTDLQFQNCWDNSQGQPGPAGGLTFYSGGQHGLDVGSGTAELQVAIAAGQADGIYPGLVAQRNGTAERFHWPTNPFTLASYACYKPGQWTSVAGAEIRAVGNMLFAGEHCSIDFQGYMNGAAVTGRVAARDALRLMRGRAALN